MEKPDKTQLMNLINYGIKLQPCKRVDSGDYVFIKTSDTIKDVEIATTDALTFWLNKGVTLFRFKPISFGLLVLDIDRGHDDGTDGLKNYYQEITKRLKRSGRRIEDLPFSARWLLDLERAPMSVETPRGGRHVYFSYDCPNPAFYNTFCDGVDILFTKYATAPGSVKNGKIYKQRGELKNIPRFFSFLITEFSKPEPKPIKKTKTAQRGRYSMAELWGFTLDDASAGAKSNELCFLFALKCKRNGYTTSEAISFLRCEPMVAHHKQITDAVKSAFKY